jgi:protein TonB
VTRAAQWDRGFGSALGVSLVLHLGAMTLLPSSQKPAPFNAPVPLSLRLAPEPLAVVAEQPQRARPAAPKPVRSKPAPRKHEETTAASAAAPQSVPPVETRQAAPAIEEAFVGAPEPAPPPPIAAPLPPTTEALATLSPAPAPRAPSAELVALYTKSLSEMFARYKEYPRIAELRGWEGSVTMRLRVAPSGRLIEAQVYKSSGFAVLDQQAVAMVSKAGVLPVPPEGLDPAEVPVLVPINFRLER